jgi:hypothetical protein
MTGSTGPHQPRGLVGPWRDVGRGPIACLTAGTCLELARRAVIMLRTFPAASLPPTAST